LQALEHGGKKSKFVSEYGLSWVATSIEAFRFSENEYASKIERERKREAPSDKERDRERQSQRETEIERQTAAERDDRDNERQSQREIERQRDSKPYRSLFLSQVFSNFFSEKFLSRWTLPLFSLLVPLRVHLSHRRTAQISFSMERANSLLILSYCRCSLDCFWGQVREREGRERKRRLIQKVT
jgi:hypothetical protein